MRRIQGYNSINIKNGYKQLEIRSPRDFMIYEENIWKNIWRSYFMREQRKRLTEILSKMTKEEIIEYFKKENLKI